MTLASRAKTAIALFPNLLWLALVESVPMPESPVVSLSPRVQLSVGRDGCTVPATASDVTDVFSLQVLHHLGTVIRSRGTVKGNTNTE